MSLQKYSGILLVILNCFILIKSEKHDTYLQALATSQHGKSTPYSYRDLKF